MLIRSVAVKDSVEIIKIHVHRHITFNVIASFYMTLYLISKNKLIRPVKFRYLSSVMSVSYYSYILFSYYYTWVPSSQNTL